MPETLPQNAAHLTQPASCPRVLIGGASSGVGKTSFTLALTRLLAERGMRVQTFKVGPDFLDPTYLAQASGRPCYNLDGWMMGREYVERLFAEKTRGADIAVIEGVMGLFDGSDPAGLSGSSAEIASWLHAPVIFVFNAHGSARSAAALVKGYALFEPEVSIAGAVANNCGSERHARWISDSLEHAEAPALCAAIPRGVFPQLPSRHLGLVTADPGNLTDATLTAYAEILAKYADIDLLLRMARNAPPAPIHAEAPVESRPVVVRIGIARDSAFHFYYNDNLETLERLGAELVPFSPIHDRCVPDGLHGIYVGGGYPEEYAEPLSANASMIDSFRRFAGSGRPLYAECGGLMYLSQGIEIGSGRFYPMAGLLPASTKMAARRKMLGYVETLLLEDSLFGLAGTVIRGHEFHYSELIGDPASDGWKPVHRLRYIRGRSDADEGFQKGGVLAGYAHLHFASRPETAERFISLCERAHANEPY